MKLSDVKEVERELDQIIANYNRRAKEVYRKLEEIKCELVGMQTLLECEMGELKGLTEHRAYIDVHRK